MLNKSALKAVDFRHAACGVMRTKHQGAQEEGLFTQHYLAATQILR